MSFELLEQQRLAANDKRTKYRLGAVGSFLGGVVLSALTELPFIAAGGLVATGVLVFFSFQQHNSYKEDYLEYVIPTILGRYGNNLTYNHDGYLNELYFSNSGLFGRYDDYMSSDLIMGTVGQTQMAMAEVKATKESTDSEGRKTLTTVFQGILLVADFNKHFRSSVYLLPDASENVMWGLGRKMQRNHHHGARLTRMDNQEFENAFKVYVGDETEGRYVLTQDLMERILQANTRLGGDLSMGFHNSYMVLAVPRYTFLEVNTKVPAKDNASLQELQYELDLFLSLIDQLNLNTRIWTKT